MGTIKDRNGKDLIEAEGIKKRMYRRSVQKDFNELGNYDGVVSHPEPDILKCEVKRALDSMAVNKAS